VGNFYVNFATHGPAQAAVAQFLRSAERKAFVSPTVSGITLFFDEESDGQDDSVIAVLGKQASIDLRAPVLAVLNHDDDILAYWLFDAGKIADEYNSCPGYFDGGEETPSGGDARILCAAFGVPTNVNEVEAVLRNEDFTFALERHEALARLLKISWEFALLGYGYIQDDSLPDGINRDRLLHT
jgi:hypothetical protein